MIRMRGFTLVELVIVLAIMLLLSAVVGTLASNTLPKSQLASEIALVADTLRRAQALTIAGKHDSPWGAHFTGSTMTLFAGSSYATRDPQYDALHTFPDGLAVSGLTDVVFVSVSGETANVGIVTLTASSTSESRTITVNAQGLVEY